MQNDDLQSGHFGFCKNIQEPRQIGNLPFSLMNLEPGNRNRGIAMLLIKGVIVMTMLSKKALKELVLYSPQHVARLE